MSKPQPNAKEAYDSGAKAKRRGFMRVTPYYEQPRANYWYLAGFDGIDFDLAAEKQPEFAISQDFCGYHTPIENSRLVTVQPSGALTDPKQKVLPA